MKVVFRVDASVDIGIGHVMRCLTLADALVQKGADCEFICREHTGNAINHIRQKGYQVYSLLSMRVPAVIPDRVLAHAHWLGATQQQDMDECEVILRDSMPDWLVFDHYAIDERWQKPMRRYCQKILVIDDLADRVHDCDLLLDQNLGHGPDDYRDNIPRHAQVLTGARYALLRPEFAQLRETSLRRRLNPRLRQILVSMGGIDKVNATGQMLEALKECVLPDDCIISVVMGESAPWLELVVRQAEKMPVPTSVLVDVSDMAQHMVNSDLAIGAAGSTSWERCCLGLPTVMVVIADNQKQVARHLQQENAVFGLSLNGNLDIQLRQVFQALDKDPTILSKMSASAAQVTDGGGSGRVVSQMLNSARGETECSN